MRTPLAWHNITHNKVRAATSLSGVCITVILIYMQLGFYDSCARSSTMVLDQLDFDVVLVSPHFLNTRSSGTVPRRRLYQAKAVPGVTRAVPVYFAVGSWRNVQTKCEHEILLIGVDPREETFQQPALVGKAHLLSRDDTAIVDTKALPLYGPITPGMVTEVDGHTVEVVDVYANGCGFVSNAEMVVSDRTLSRLLNGVPQEDVSLGLIKLKPGWSLEDAVRDLKAVLPADVQVWTRADIDAHSSAYSLRIKPLGIMFSSGVLLALIVGGVIIYQILASEIMNHLKQYATLKAIGYSNTFLSLVVLRQATIFACCGFVPATLVSQGMYVMTRASTNLPMYMTAARAALVLLLSIVMCCLSGLLVSRKVRSADPVDLF